MAEGGGEFGFYDPELDHVIDNEPYDDDDDEQEVSTTGTFQPGAASTPHGGEQYEMQTMQHEQSGLPDTSYEEAPLLGAQAQSQRSWNALTRLFPEASSIDLETSYSKTGRLQVKMAGVGKKAYDHFTKDRSGGQQLNPKLTKEIIKSLGRRAEQIIEEGRNTAQEQRQRLEEAEKQLREAEKIAAEREKEAQEMQDLERKIERAQANIDAIQEEQGSNLESEAELRRLKQLKKESADLEKQAKNKEKIQEKVDRERKKLYGIQREKNAIEERLNETKRLDELNGDEGRLKRLNEEDQAIIDDPNTPEFDKEAAREKIAARNEELSRLQTQIAEREAAMPLRERVREIFKKHGVTVTAIFLAAGITIKAVVGAITNALKSMGKQLANGLKTVGAKAASALPGLIGTIVSFIFKTVGQAMGYLAGHTWLLILAAVVFIFEKYIKKRR